MVLIPVVFIAYLTWMIYKLITYDYEADKGHVYNDSGVCMICGKEKWKW